MVYKSIFDYLKDDETFKDAYNTCIAMEKNIIMGLANTSIGIARSASEMFIKLVIKEEDEKFYNYLNSQVDQWGNKKEPTLNKMIRESRDRGYILNHLFNKYKEVKNSGNANVHGNKLEQYDLEKSKEIHGYLFEIARDCYNKYHKNDPVNIKYRYCLDGEYDIEFSPEEKDFILRCIHTNEISKESLQESLESKSIFVPMNSFNELKSKYEEKIRDKEKLEKYLKNISFIDEENIDHILKFFMGSSHNNIKADITEKSNKLSADLLNAFKNINQNELTVTELNFMIKNSNNAQEKSIYESIKVLSDDLAKSQLEIYKKELENAPISYLSEIGRKVIEYNKYKINEDDFGFSIGEVEGNILLDDDQEEAVKYDGEKPLIINAGPGSGKTRVIIERVVHLITELDKEPSSILVITFTRKATQELRERLIYETDLDMNDINKIRISTVHGFCRHLISKYEPMPYNYLNRHGERSLFFQKYKADLGFINYAFLYNQWVKGVLEKYDEYFNFKIDTEGLVNSLKISMEEYENNNKKYMRFVDNFYSKKIKEKNAITPKEIQDIYLNEYPNMKDERFKRYKSPNYHFVRLNVAKSYPEFKEILEKTKTCDDNNILEKANELLENDYILNDLPYTNILIDEFQDTDRFQREIFEKLLTIRDTFTVVGDIDQSIFEWRGAFPKNFEDFMKKDDVKVVTLHTNYRSTRDIVEFNEALIKDKRTIPKEITAKKKYKSPILFMGNKNVDEEAFRIVDLINNLKNDKKIKYYSDVAILFRTNASVERLIKPFEAANIPYFLKDYKDFLDQSEVRAILTMFWYLMPYEKTKLNFLEEDFLNYYGFTDVKYKSSHIFRLSKETRDLLEDTQKKYEENVLKIVNDNQLMDFESYKDVFDLDEHIKTRIFDEIDVTDISLLDEEGLIEFGITDENDLRFFKKLNELKAEIWNFNSNGEIESFAEKYDTLKIFYELYNVTDYFNDISLDDNPNAIKIKDNMALFSHIVKDYESIMGDYDLIGLFRYLSRVLTGYASPFNEDDDGFNKVHLLSMHSAKGLQYPIVIVGSLKQGLCPLEFDDDDFPYPTPRKYLEYKDTDKDIARENYELEELRTIYVATTRAKEVLILSIIGQLIPDYPEFLQVLKRNPDLNTEVIEPYNLSKIPVVESSKVFKTTEEFPNINFEDLVNDFLYCPFRYDVANNTRFKVKLKNDKYIDIVLHNLLKNIHSKVNVNNEDEFFTNYEISEEDVNEKIDTIIDYHNLSSSNNTFTILKNVGAYWRDYGKNYKVIGDNINILTQMKYCDLHSLIDLVIEEEDGKISIVKFIGTDSNIPNIGMYKLLLNYYVYALKQFDEYKDKEFKNIYLHSLENNKRYEDIPYQEELIEGILGVLENYTKEIHDKRWRKEFDNCENCEYFGNVCRG